MPFSSEGNLVSELDNGNPSKLLVAAIRMHGIHDKESFKEDDFYLGAFRGNKVRISFFVLSQRCQSRAVEPGIPHSLW
jgi:hypothetical protein